jgi:hypothetical protein
MTAEGRQMKRGKSKLVLGPHIGAMLGEELREINMTVHGRIVEWSGPMLVLDCHIGTMLDEK